MRQTFNLYNKLIFPNHLPTTQDTESLKFWNNINKTTMATNEVDKLNICEVKK